jgi:hypothetical protein
MNSGSDDLPVYRFPLLSRQGLSQTTLNAIKLRKFTRSANTF